nr:MAG TPA: hypothetical protein [Bacteriophage sp.]
MRKQLWSWGAPCTIITFLLIKNHDHNERGWKNIKVI